MDSDRARAILAGIEGHQDISVTPDERDALVGQGLLKGVDAATHDAWTAAVANLSSLRDRVRDLSRQALATPGPDAPPELRQLIANLEEMTRQKAALDSLIWNGPTQEFLHATLPGRSLLEDLTTWQSRLGGRDLDAFRGEMDTYRAGLGDVVTRAQRVHNVILMDEQSRLEEAVSDVASPYTSVDFRFAATILAKRALDPYLLAQTFQWFNHETSWGSFSKEDHLATSVILASLPVEPMVVRNNFERLRIQLEYHGIMPEDRLIVAASLADLHESWWPQLFDRIDAIKRDRPPLNSLLVGALARSPYPVEETLARFDAIQSGMAEKGFKDGIQMQVAATLLAAAQLPQAALVDRFAETLSHVQGSFESPFPPAAMLAANPLEPHQAVDVFRDCIGAVTRMSFFELTLEIEELALIMSYGVAPLGTGYAAASLPAAPPLTPLVPAAAPVFLGPGLSWYVWHNYFVYRPIGRYIATHPVHIHTVAAFG